MNLDFADFFGERSQSSSSYCSCSSDGYEDLENDTPDRDGRETVPLLKDVLGQLSLNEEALERILDPRDLSNIPVAVISVAGAFRLGKSFILNFFLRYLQNEGWQSGDGSWLQGWSSSENQGIKWRGGAEGDTRGILALRKPIIVKRSNGEKLAVLLLDTQGNFEHGRSREENVGIFALSTLFSSLQIFNISKQIQTNDLEYLQDLLFLVRDWQNPVSHLYGIDGGQSYLESVSRFALDAPAYQYLNRAFSEVNCFLMPEPSTEVRITETKNKNLTAADLGKSFSQCLTQFADKYLHPDRIKPKTLGFAGPVTASALLDHVKRCAKKILSGETPEFPSLMKLIAWNANRKALEEAEKKFVSQVWETIAGMEEPSWGEFEKVLKDEKLRAKKIFLDKTSFGKEIDQLDLLEPFDQRIQSAQPHVKKLMQRRRHLRIEEEIKIWLDESIERLQFRNMTYTYSTELEKIRDERVKLLPVKHDKDPDSVLDILEDAKQRLHACCDENIRDAGLQNRKVTLMLGVSALVGVAVGGPITVAGILVGQTSIGGAVGLTAGCAVAAKSCRDGIQGMKERLSSRKSKLFSWRTPIKEKAE